MARSHTRRRKKKVKIECFFYPDSGGCKRMPSVYVSGDRPKTKAFITAKEQRHDHEVD